MKVKITKTQICETILQADDKEDLQDVVNTAIAIANNPVEMAKAFALSVEAGRMAYEAGLGKISHSAEASSPLTSFLD